MELEEKKDSLVEKKLKCVFTTEPIDEHVWFYLHIFQEKKLFPLLKNQYAPTLTSGIVPREVADQLPFLRSHDAMMFPPALVGIIILLTILATLLSC